MKIGDIIKAGNSKLKVVTSCGMRIDKAYDSDYSVFEFSTVNLPEQSSIDVSADASRQMSDVKFEHFYVSGYSMKGKGKEVNREDIKIVGSCVVKEKVEISVNLSKIRLNM